MKKKLLVIVFAILVGGVLALPALQLKKDWQKEEYTSLYVLQSGVFKNYENALEKQASLLGSVIVQEQGTYYVYAGVSLKEKDLERMEKILQEKQIAYYKKQIMVKSNKETLEKYNLLLQKADNEETLLLVNKKMLESVSFHEL